MFIYIFGPCLIEFFVFLLLNFKRVGFLFFWFLFGIFWVQALYQLCNLQKYFLPFCGLVSLSRSLLRHKSIEF